MSAGPTRVNLCWINRNKRHACRGFVVVFPAFPSSYPKLAQPALNLGSINHPTKEFVAGVTFELPEVMDILLEQKQSGTLTCLLSRRFFWAKRTDTTKDAKGRSVHYMGLWQQFFRRTSNEVLHMFLVTECGLWCQKLLHEIW